MINIFTENRNVSFSPEYQINSFVLLPIIALIAIYHTLKLIKNRAPLAKILLILTVYVYIYTVISLTIFPISYFTRSSNIHKYSFGKQFMIIINPFEWIKYSKFQIIGNVLVLMPLSFFGGFIFPKMRKLSNAVISCFLVSLLVEVIQLIMNYFYLGNRVFDTGDLLLNTLGGLIGYFLMKLMFKIFSKDRINNVLGT
jgi:glycopeptide antibiotics resistance protein